MGWGRKERNDDADRRRAKHDPAVALLAMGRGSVDLPDALVRKMPGAAKSLPWQYVFSASRPWIEKRARGRDAIKTSGAAARAWRASAKDLAITTASADEALR